MHLATTTVHCRHQPYTSSPLVSTYTIASMHAVAKRKRSRALPVKPRRRRPPKTQRVATAAVAGGKLALCEVGERVVLSFLPLVPDRLAAERVCSRWRRVSQLETAVRDLDFGGVALRSVTKQRVAQLVRRADGQLRSLALPDVQLDDAIVQSVCENLELRTLRAYRMPKKHVFQILAACQRLEVRRSVGSRGSCAIAWHLLNCLVYG